MKILMISGKAGSGKDTFANEIKNEIELRNKTCIVLHFADLVKYFCKEYYGWDGVKDAHGRQLLQLVGTNKVRTKFPNYWAEIIAKFLSAAENDFDAALIPDARFPNEIETVQDYNSDAYAIRIERYNEDNSLYVNNLLTKEQQMHPSETSLDGYPHFDFMIKNHGTDLSELRTAAKKILMEIGL